jgi:nucleoside-diphosphate-sugar epimerase
MSTARVGIIGGAGFIGSYCTRLFVEKAHRVKVGVTDKAKKSKYEHLFTLAPGGNLDVAQVNVLQKDTLAAFITGCQYLVHAGTPFQLDVANPQEDLFNPTVQGTKNLLDAILEAGTVERVVFVSSVSSYNTNFPFPPDGKNPQDLITEQATPYYSEASNPYAQAKFKAHQVVEQFLKEHQDITFDIVTLSPASVVGKQLSGRNDSTTAGFQHLVKNGSAPNAYFEMLYAANPYLALIAVEDVASSIYAATTRKGNHGANFLLSSESYRISDMQLLLNGKEAVDEPIKVYANDLAEERLDLKIQPMEAVLKRIYR